MANSTKGKADKKQEVVEDLFVEPPLMYRLFPTLMKGRKPSEKALAKAAEKAKAAPVKIKPRLPIADLLPMALVLEVRKREITRVFALLWALAFAMVGAGWTMLGNGVAAEQAKLDEADAALQQAQIAYAQVAPYVSYVEDVQEAGTFANTEALNQLDNSAVIQTMTAATGNIATISTYTISYGIAAEGATCSSVSAGGGGSIFDGPSEGTTVTGIGCLTFTAVAATPEAGESVQTSLRAAPGVTGAVVKTGNLTENGQVTLTGEALLGEEFRIKPGLGLTIPLEGLADPIAAAAVQPAAPVDPATETAPAEGATP